MGQAFDELVMASVEPKKRCPGWVKDAIGQIIADAHAAEESGDEAASKAARKVIAKASVIAEFFGFSPDECLATWTCYQETGYPPQQPPDVLERMLDAMTAWSTAAM